MQSDLCSSIFEDIELLILQLYKVVNQKFINKITSNDQKFIIKLLSKFKINVESFNLTIINQCTIYNVIYTKFTLYNINFSLVPHMIVFNREKIKEISNQIIPFYNLCRETVQLYNIIKLDLEKIYEITKFINIYSYHVNQININSPNIIKHINCVNILKNNCDVCNLNFYLNKIDKGVIQILNENLDMIIYVIKKYNFNIIIM